MHANYQDIISRIPEAPKWWDENAVPRYEDFSPAMLANIYAEECALIEITCQGCGQKFHVSMSQSRWQTEHEGVSLLDMIKSRDLHYGDPPHTDCCAAGPTMNSEPRLVLQFWQRNFTNMMSWERHREFEYDITPEWAAPQINILSPFGK